MTFWTNYRAKLSKTKAVLDFFESQLKIAPLTMNNQELSFDGLQLVNIYHGGGGGVGGGRWRGWIVYRQEMYVNIVRIKLLPL